MSLTLSKLNAMFSAAEPEHTTACAQQLEDAMKLISAPLMRQMQETNKILAKQLARLMKETVEDCLSSVAKQMAKTCERFLAPSFVPPPLYLTQRTPQIRYIYVYIDDLPGLN